MPFYRAPWGTFETFYAAEPFDSGFGECPPGHYWHACQPGCLPDGEPIGPFPSEVEARKRAMFVMDTMAAVGFDE